MNRLLKYFVVLGVFGAYLFNLTLSAATYTQMGVEPIGDFVIEPAKIEVFLDPGETATRFISVTSRVQSPTSYDISLEDFIGATDGSVAVRLLGNDTSPYSFKNNLILDTNKFDLNFGQKITIPITITAPLDAAPGGYYTSVVVSNSSSDGGQQGTGTKIVSRVAQLLFIRVNGEVEESGRAVELRLGGNYTPFVNAPKTFEVLFENTGSVHLTPYGNLVIKNLFGKVVGSVPVDAYYSLPKSLRYRQLTLNKLNLFGYYKAELSLNRSYRTQSDVVDNLKVSFWVLPWQYLLIVGVLAIVIGITVKFIRRKKVRATPVESDSIA